MENGRTLMAETLLELAARKQYGTLRNVMIAMNAPDIAEIFAELPEESILPLLFRLLPKELAAEVFVEMPSELQATLIQAFSDSELRAVVEELYADDAADLIEEMPAGLVKRILRQADPAFRQAVNELLRYPERSAGSVMTTEYVALHPEMTVAQAMAHIRATGVDKETINTCYVTETKGRRLIGVVSIRGLILAAVEETVENIMRENPVAVSTLEDREEVTRLFTRYDLPALPVVDGENRLVGIVTFDDAMDVMEEEATEDMEVMAGMTPTDEPYLSSSVFNLFKSRIPWLLLMLLSATFTGLIISSFEASLAVLPALTAFIPMLMGTGGNAGSQSSVTVIRGISLGEIELRDVFRVVFKEFRISLLAGICLSACTFLKILLFDFYLLGFGTGNRVEDILVSATVAATLFATVCLAKLIGCTLPMLAKKLGFDPAVMASPFITTLVDALSLILYFGFASAILSAYM